MEASEADEEGSDVYEINVERVTADMVTVRATSREEAFEALKHPKSREVQTALVRKDFSGLMEEYATDGRKAEEYEDMEDFEPDIDLTDS